MEGLGKWEKINQCTHWNLNPWPLWPSSGIYDDLPTLLHSTVVLLVHMYHSDLFN
jgi:hypothetical protein